MTAAVACPAGCQPDVDLSGTPVLGARLETVGQLLLKGRMDPETCTRCGGQDIISDYVTGDVVCRGCGEVQAQRIADQRAEWRTFDDDFSGDRVGGDLDGIQARIFGTSASAPRRKRGSEATAASIVHKKAKVSERKLEGIAILLLAEVRRQNLKEEVKSVALQLLDEAWKVEDGKLFRGVDEKDMAAAVLYLSCKQCDVVTSIKEMAMRLDRNKTKVGQAINAITDKISGIGNVVFSAEQVVDKHATQLELTPAERSRATSAIVKAKAVEDVGGMQPQTLSGAVLLLALMVQRRAFLMDVKAEGAQAEEAQPLAKDMTRTEVSVADVTRVTMVSAAVLKKVHAKLYEKRHVILPDEYLKELAARNLEPTPTRELV